jgi:hypothetical protein
VNRVQKIVAAIAIVAVPAAAYSALAPRQSACFTSGAASYRIVPGADTPDFRIKIAGDSARPDLRMQLVDRAEIADVVLVDDGSDEESGCGPSLRVRTVTVDAGARRPDVTVALTTDADAADYRLYVRSVRFSQRDAMALLAAAWKAGGHRQMAAQTVR